jgi:hypothetical protein
MNAWVLHRDEKIFGPDAHVFRPERWLGTKEEVAPLERNLFTVSAHLLLHHCHLTDSCFYTVWRRLSNLYRQEHQPVGTDQVDTAVILPVRL